MNAASLILKKRNGFTLTNAEIDFFIDGYVKGQIPDYQASALLMAIYFQGLDKRETVALTRAMIASGDTIDLASIPGIKVDKHSTGGVGDKTTLILAPLVAALGIPVAKLSGRGLGHTGGTIDKLEAIKGMRVELSQQELVKQVKKIGIAIAAQTGEIVPADKKLYALRDVTATVENKSLIAASIMSKKLASGADAIVLDVKYGDGAFMKTTKDAFELALLLTEIGNGMGKKTVALITGMEQPLGNAIGNALEVKEAIETLQGKGSEDLLELCTELAIQMVLLSGAGKNESAARKKINEALQTGKAFDKLKEFVKAQGGDTRHVENPELLPQAKYSHKILSFQSGYVKMILAESVGNAAMILGAGRMKKEDAIDLSAGILLHKKIGDAVKRGDALATLFSNDKQKFKASEQLLVNAYHFSKRKIKLNPLLIGKVSKGKRTFFEDVRDLK